MEVHPPPVASRVLAVGIGKGAGQIIDQIDCAEPTGVDTMYVATDESSLRRTGAGTKVLIGRRLFGGKGAMGYPDLGERAAEDAKRDLEEYLRGYDLIIIIGSLGKGTGSGVTPVVASLAESTGALVLNFLIIPSSTVESLPRSVANHTRNKMVTRGFNVITLDQERFFEINGKEPLSSALARLDALTSAIVLSLVDVLYGKVEKGISLSDLRTVFRMGNEGSIFLGGGYPNSPEEAARDFLSCGLINRNPKTAKGMVLNIVSPAGTSLRSTEPLVDQILSQMGGKNRPVFVGKIDDPERTDYIDLIGIVTGMDDGKYDFRAECRKSAAVKTAVPVQGDRWEIPMVR